MLSKIEDCLNPPASLRLPLGCCRALPWILFLCPPGLNGAFLLRLDFETLPAMGTGAFHTPKDARIVLAVNVHSRMHEYPQKADWQ